MVFFVQKESWQSNGYLKAAWTIWVAVLLPVFLSSLICQSSVSLSNLNELSNCERIIWIFIRMLYQAKLSVSSLNGCSVSVWLYSKDLEWVKWLQRFDLANLVSSQSPKSPKQNGDEDFEEETRPHPSSFVCLLSLFYSLLTARTIAVLSSQFELLLSKYHCLKDVVGKRNQNYSQNWNKEIVEGWIIIIQFLFLLSVEVILKVRHTITYKILY